MVEITVAKEEWNQPTICTTIIKKDERGIRICAEPAIDTIHLAGSLGALIFLCPKHWEEHELHLKESKERWEALKARENKEMGWATLAIFIAICAAITAIFYLVWRY